MSGSGGRRFLLHLTVGFLLCGPVSARTLPLPDNLVTLNSDAGEQMLLTAPARQSYWDLSIQFVTQKTQSFCGVASIVMVLDALGVPAPSTPAYEPYQVYTQDNVLSEQTEAVHGPCDAGVIRTAAATSGCARRSQPWVLATTILGSGMAFNC